MADRVSDFIVSVCQMLPKCNKLTNVYDSIRSPDYLIACGSSAEFFIQPLQSCIGDLDYLLIRSCLLIFTNERPVLPYDVRHIADPINCLLMEPYQDYPAFVRLRLFGQIRYNWEYDDFEFSQASLRRIIKTTEITEYSTTLNCEDFFKVGPASRSRIVSKGSMEIDFVPSIWSPQWPNEAKNWPFRRRKHGWPPNAIIQEVMQNGCHVVLARHPACRNDENQFRLSFSVAEIILLQSWSKQQQIVYHMLKFFAKRELIEKDCSKDDEVLCTYHFKTLMLWSCEEMPPEWWNSSSVIEQCCNLLKKLENWLKEKKCQNYFIPEANLFHKHFSQKVVDETASKLNYYCHSDNLSLWFAKHYIPPVGVHFVNDDNMLLVFLKAIKESYPKCIEVFVSFTFGITADKTHALKEKLIRVVLIDIFKCRPDTLFGEELYVLPVAMLESCNRFYESMLHILHAHHLLHCRATQNVGKLFLKLIRHVANKPKYFRSKHHNLPRTLSSGVNESQLYFIKAQDLMENLTLSTDDLEFKAVSEISKGLLKEVLKCENCRRNGIFRVTLAYMAALHYTGSEYQSVLDLCFRMTRNEYCEKENTETLNAGCLLHIEDISIIIGFYLIFIKTKDASLQYTRRRFFLDLRLAPEVFAHYLMISSIERTSGVFVKSDILQKPKFLLDAILMSVTNRKMSQKSKKTKNIVCVYGRNYLMQTNSDAPIEMSLPNKGYLMHLLQNYALGHMTSFYNAISKDFEVDCSTADCYRAAYLYQCREYPEVLHLCEQILNGPDLRSDLKELAFANVLILPPLDSFFDRDVQSLLGLHTLVCFLSPSNEDLGKTEVSGRTTFKHYLARQIYLKQSLVSSVLHETYSLKCHYFLGRYFLARYLKVRCLIDCTHPFSDVEFEFKKLKVALPFEQYIRCFVEQKLRQLLRVIDDPSKA